MKRSILLAFATLALFATVAQAGEKPWFDFENCVMCKHMAAEPGFFENVNWDNHVIENGALSVTTVPASFQEAYARVRGEMAKTGAQLMAGEELPVCGYCTSYLALMKTGEVNMQEVQTIGGLVTLLTSDNPELVAKIQEQTKRTITEMEKMEAAHADHKSAM
jgi:hypothetical protein